MGQKALITGATAGIGEAAAIALAKAGYDVFITGRREDRLDRLTLKLKKDYSVDVFPMCFDVSDKEACKQAVSERHAQLAGLNVVVNNAGLAVGTDPVHTARISDWETMVQTNVLGLMYMTRLLLPYLEANGFGDIVNIGSVAGRWVYPGGAVYCATKHAVSAFSEGLRWDLHKKNIRVINIEPGKVETEFSLVRFNNDEKKAKQVYSDGRPLKADDIASTILWCLSRPSHVNIQELVVYPTDQPGVMSPN